MKLNSHVFTYGSLSIPVVMETVTGQMLRNTEAVLCGFERYMLKSKPYPGIVQSKTSSTEGRVYFNLDADALNRLDYFEDDYYVRQVVDLELPDQTPLRAFAYVVPAAKHELLSNRSWNERTFVEQQLDGYLAQARRWMESFEGAK